MLAGRRLQIPGLHLGCVSQEQLSPELDRVVPGTSHQDEALWALLLSLGMSLGGLWAASVLCPAAPSLTPTRDSEVFSECDLPMLVLGLWCRRKSSMCASTLPVKGTTCSSTTKGVWMWEMLMPKLRSCLWRWMKSSMNQMSRNISCSTHQPIKRSKYKMPSPRHGQPGAPLLYFSAASFCSASP